VATGSPKTKWKLNPANNKLVGMPGFSMALSYEGKASELEILSTQPISPVEAWRGQPATLNRLYFSDNLPTLAHLLNDAQIKGNVRLIYIDPPFATNSVFHSRTQSDAYQDLLTGATYVEFIRKRLVLLRELLSEDGSIYVHLDDNMTFHIKLIMDEVFGLKNFRNCITRRKCSHKNFTRKTYGNISDYILFYTKTDNYIWNRSMEEWTTERAKKEYPCIDKKTGRRYKKVPIHAPGTRNGETGKPWRGMLPPLGKHWQYLPKTLDEMDARGEMYWSPTGNPRRKVYFDDSEGVAVQDIWYDFRDDRNQNVHITGYPTEKNPELLSRIIKASSNPGDIVLDCFSGSGTTLAVAEELDRQWIGIDNSAEALKVTFRRFTKGVERMGDYVIRKDLETGKSSQSSMLSLLEDSTSDFKEQAQDNGWNFSVMAEEDSHENAITIIKQQLQS